jgi:hypothetical protein
LIKSITRNWSWLRRNRDKQRASVAISRADELKRRLPDATQWQLEIIRTVEPATMTSPERILALCEATRYLIRNQIEGDIVECGVWRGGSMAAVARTLQHMRASNRRLWLYDTFDGMSPPTKADVDFLGRPAARMMDDEKSSSLNPNDPKSIWCRSPLEGVRQTMIETDYPLSQIRFVKGMVEQTLLDHKPEKVALLRLDTDWYESTKCELEQLFPRMVPGAVLIIDDYGHWDGCRRAVDEYFEQHRVRMLLNRIDYTARIGIYWPQPQTSLVSAPLGFGRIAQREGTGNHGA